MICVMWSKITNSFSISKPSCVRKVFYSFNGYLCLHPLRWMVGTCCLWIMIVRCELKRFTMTTESSYWRSSMIPKAIRHSGFPAASCCQLTWHTPGKSFLLGGKTSLFLGFISGTLDRQRIRISQWMWQATMTGQSQTLHGRKVMWTDMNTRNTGFPA